MEARVSRGASTTDSILYESAKLFAHKGFHGTTIQEIADAVGIRKPSLFHHFASKAAIARALVEYDYERSPSLQGKSELAGASPSVRLFQIIRREVTAQLTSKYDMRGLYFSALLDEPDFASWRQVHAKALADIVQVYQEGVKSGEFVDWDAHLAVEALNAIILQAVHWSANHPDMSVSNEVAEMAIRLAVSDPNRIPAIRQEADALLQRADKENKVKGGVGA
ncbi:MAG: hypothetical protein C0482_28800 [Gordonia sp.]|nr:hypothetical protein [Gordonia sp. (in: high G+C Gram-positive bacteria)]